MEPAFEQVVENGYSVREHEGVVLGEARNAGSQDYPFRERRRLGYEEVGSRNVLLPRGEMLSYPRFPKADAVEEDYLLHVFFYRVGEIGTGRMKGYHEVSEFHVGEIVYFLKGEWGNAPGGGRVFSVAGAGPRAGGREIELDPQIVDT